MPEIDEGLLLTPEQLDDCYMKAEIPKAGYVENTKAIAKYTAEAQLAKATPIIRKQQQEEDTAYYAEMMKEAIDRVSKEAKKQERERIIEIAERLIGSTSNPEWQALKGE